MRTGAPPRVSVAMRLANVPTSDLPVQAPLRIAWDSHQIPSVQAASMADLATGLGVVHAHLRLAQLEAMRRLATARVSEAIGPAGVALDRAILLMDLARAVPAIEAMLPEPTRVWAEGFVAGLNHVIAGAPALPHEFALAGLAPAPWTLRDLLAVSRLAATDVSWLVFARLLRARQGMDAAAWQLLWPALQGGDRPPSPERSAETAFGFGRGSNCAVVCAAASSTGAGLIASDPHLSVGQPPLWLIAGLHAPGLDAVGLMIPGIPAIALGRNRHLAWGGTNLHAASSELIDVSGEPMHERPETIPVRGAAPVTLLLRQTRFGPVVSDGILLRAATPLALRWVGHHPSDELSALLGVLQSRSLETFRDSLRGFAVPGQTMLAVEAGALGRAGRTVAAHLPRRPTGPMPSLVCPANRVWSLDDLICATDLPQDEAAIVVSANDRPAASPVPIGFFFAPSDRMRRLQALLASRPVTPETMHALQQDVLHPAAITLRDALLARCPPISARTARARAALAEWDGAYTRGSEGALVFEALVAGLARRMIPPPRLRALSAIWTGRAIIAERIAQQASPAAIKIALDGAARILRRHNSWGAAHRLALRHPLASLPLLGYRYAVPDLSAPGSNDTLHKTGHGLVAGRHQVTFGAGARHLSDLSDPNANRFVLLGGQDGWLGSANARDQVPLWRSGDAIAVPLDAEATRSWPYQMVLTPRGGL